MTILEDFDVDEDALRVLCPSALKTAMKKIQEVARLRRERQRYLEEAAKTSDDEQKSIFEYQAEQCREKILALMPYVAIYERGRKRVEGMYL